MLEPKEIIGLAKELAEKDRTALMGEAKRKIKFAGGEDNMEKVFSISALLKGIITGNVPAEMKDLYESGTGGYLVPPEHATYLYDVLTDAVVVRKAGATVLPMKSNTLTIPKAITGATAYWVSEGTAPTLSDMTFAQITLTAKKVAAATVISTELLEDSNPSVDRIVMDNLANTLAVAMDKEFLLGDGTNLTGIVNTAGVNTINGNGGDLTLDHILEAKKLIEAGTKGNIKPNAIVMHPAVYYKLLKTAKETTGAYLWNSNGLTAGLPDTLFGLKVFLTTSIPIDLTYSDGSNTYNNQSLVIVGDFKQALIGERRGITVKATAEGQYLLNGTVAVVATARVGFGVAYPEAFTVISNISAV